MFSTSYKQAKNQWIKVGTKLFVFKDPVEVGDNFDSCLGFYDPGKKLMVKRMLISDESLERMEREYKWMEAWEKHQNILDWVSLDQDDRYLYLSQERWSFTLENLVNFLYSLDTTSPLEPPKALDVFIQKNRVKLNKVYIDGLMVDLMKDVGKGLTHLHQMGFVHRDLRPQNIVIVCGTKSMSAKIANFCFTEDSKLNSKERSKLKKICKSETDFQPAEQKQNYSRRQLCKIVGRHCNWEKMIDSRVVTHMKNDHQKKTGNLVPPNHFERVWTLIRLLRNQYTHFFELSPNIQAIYSGTLEGMLEYYSGRFPTLLKIVYMEFGLMQDAAFKEFKTKYYS